MTGPETPIAPRRTPFVAAVGLVVATALGLSGCGGSATADDLDTSRTEVVAAAQDLLPGIVEALGGEIEDAYGEFRSGGDGVVDRRQYDVTVVVTGADGDIDDLVAALEAAGVDDVRTSPMGGASGTHDGLTVGGSDPGGRDMGLGVTGPYLHVADGVPRETGREQIALG